MIPIPKGSSGVVRDEAHARFGERFEVLSGYQEYLDVVFGNGDKWVINRDQVGIYSVVQSAEKLDVVKHSHYFKACPFDHVDVYRVLALFDVTDPCIQHAVKKLLVAGGRGHKDIAKDIQDSIDTLERWKAMRAEERPA